jgi:hypothetical protein
MIKNIFISIFFIALVFLLFELCFIAVYYVSDGEYLSVTEKLAAEDNNYLKKITKDLKCNYNASIIQHPYLGFVHNSNPPCNYSYINKSGYYGPDFPATKRDDVFTVMILGGSVASMFGQSTNESIEKKLNRKYKKDGKNIVVLNGAIEAWKQPQQVITLLLYGDLIDAVISIEGYNELMMSLSNNFKHGLEKPWQESYLAVSQHESNEMYFVYLWLNNKIIGSIRISQ